MSVGAMFPHVTSNLKGETSSTELTDMALVNLTMNRKILRPQHK
jgi:hypothetical protein